MSLNCLVTKPVDVLINYLNFVLKYKIFYIATLNKTKQEKLDVSFTNLVEFDT